MLASVLSRMFMQSSLDNRCKMCYTKEKGREV